MVCICKQSLWACICIKQYLSFCICICEQCLRVCICKQYLYVCVCKQYLRVFVFVNNIVRVVCPYQINELTCRAKKILIIIVPSLTQTNFPSGKPLTNYCNTNHFVVFTSYCYQYERN